MSEVRSEPVPTMRNALYEIEELQRRVQTLERNAVENERMVLNLQTALRETNDEVATLVLRAPVSDASAGAPSPALTPSRITAEILTAGLSRAELLRINYCVSKRLLHFAQ
jgi:hypothetical protein